MAEVTLVLDNSDGRAPAPFDTAPILEVTRRIRRAAGSTFRINGKEVRARDVQLLFADASTGANSPALVRQNQVSELINAKPENRRRILEEAAGIAGLYTRRHEAELKLRGAQTNLERLDDVAAGLADQLAGLRRQARQAARYRTLADDIRNLEAFLLAKRWQHVSQAVAATHRARDAAQTALAEAMLRANRAAKAAENADDGLVPLREEQAIAEAVLRRLDGQRFGLERDLKAAQDALTTARNDLARIAQARTRETSLQDDALATLARLQAELAELDHDNVEAGQGEKDGLLIAQEAAANAQIALAQLEADFNHAMSTRANARAQHEANVRACAEAKAVVQRHVNNLTQAQSALARINASLPHPIWLKRPWQSRYDCYCRKGGQRTRR
ncbi:MAG: hypothetical protein HC777_02915 [Hyphomonadaceae bacterium]|nr:hypothetical protein [Hyphomonadaceae bacterium]